MSDHKYICRKWRDQGYEDGLAGKNPDTFYEWPGRKKEVYRACYHIGWRAGVETMLKEKN